MLIAGLGAALYVLTQVFRFFWCPPKTPVGSANFVAPLLACVLADALVACGSVDLLRHSPVDVADYNQVITVISLLTAGVIAGRFSVTHQDAGDDERVLVLLVSGGFTLLLFALFTSICFYAGGTTAIRTAPNSSYIFGGIIFLVLAIDTIHDYWDYHEAKKTDEPHG